MIPRSMLYARFMKDPVPARLGAIASDLTRLSGLTKIDLVNEPLFQSVLNEIKFFTEWAAGDLSLDIQEKLLELQRTLAGWTDPPLHDRPSSVEREAPKWSEEILSMSGLLI